MTALVSVRRRWTVGALVGGLVAAALLAVLGYIGVDTLRNSKEGRPANTLPAGRTLPPTPAALLAVRGDGGELSSLAVLALAPPGEDGVARGGTIIPVPVGAGIQNGTDERRIRLADYYSDGGISGLADAAASLLSVNFSVVAEVDESGLSDLLQPLGGVQANVPGDVRNSTADGADEVVVPAGEQIIRPDRAAALMAARLEDEPESARFEQSLSYWKGVQDHVGDGLTTVGVSATSGGDTVGMQSFLRSVLAGPVRVYPLRGEPISRGIENPDGVDVYRLNAAEVIRVMATVLPDAISPVDVAFTVQVINPTGDPSLTQAAVERLAFQGVGIVLVRELVGIDIPATTELSLGGRTDIAEVQPYADGLGETVVVPLGPPGTPHGRVLGVDATFVLGESFRNLVDRQSATTTVAVAKPTTTTPGFTPSTSTTKVAG